ncbi:Hsp20/alpha crystallin family protein [Caballeronia sp. LZ001]|uniref:Hsp20/alpha crystallin family protein n=1 Tax=Caballeronia sp. LZ001 TaxID=3038553 RepID=UPI00285CE1AF|nr:Hsp20/alpha crystallin family protein [Caballeronia sp. LZ001]MDR5806633.1 Hsp20/alpha crystallin family protein [Caballeronia sp. LZ001]
MSDLFFGTSLFEDFNRLQNQMSSLLSGSPSSLRAARAGTFPHINMGVTDDSVEIVAFAPGIDPTQLNVTIEKGLLLISGERQNAARSDNAEQTRTYAQERFNGSFRRAIELPRDADPDKVQARYANGCLTVSVGKRESSKPRAIAVQ